MTPQLLEGDMAGIQLITCKGGMEEEPQHIGHFVLRNSDEDDVFGWITPEWEWKVDVARTMYNLGYKTGHSDAESPLGQIPEGMQVIPVTPEMAAKVKAMMGGQPTTPQQEKETTPEYIPGGYL